MSIARIRILCLLFALALAIAAYGKHVENYDLGGGSVYTGQLVDGEPHGYGTLRYTRGKHAGSVYTGYFRRGYKHGLGRWVKANGEMEFGEFVDGVWKKPANQAFQPGELIYGIDLSAHNRKVNLADVAIYTDRRGLRHGPNAVQKDIDSKKYMQPVQFVYLRATTGASDMDSVYAKFSAQAQKCGIPKGSYHLLCYNTSTPEAQADNFIKQCKGFKNDQLIPVIDIEDISNQATKAGKVKVQQTVDRFLKYFEKKTGIKPIIYTGNTFSKKFLDMKRFKGYTVWMARYGAEQPDYHPWYIWQFTHKGTVRGYNGPIDIDFYDGTRESFDRKVRLRK